MNFQYTKYKEMLSEIIAHIELDDKKFHSSYALMDYYCELNYLKWAYEHGKKYLISVRKGVLAKWNT